MARTIGTTSDSAVETALTTPEKTTFNMSLPNMPIACRDKFKKLKAEGKVSGSFNAYLRQSVIDKLKIDDI